METRAVYRVSKYNARPTVVDGIRFDSMAEARRYGELRLMEQAGEIRHLDTHPRFHLLDTLRRDGKTYRAVRYEADFRYTETATGNTIVEDVKGVETPVFKLKLHLLLQKYPYIDFRIIRV